MNLDTLSPTLRAACLLSGVTAASHALNLDTTSPQSLAAHISRSRLRPDNPACGCNLAWTGRTSFLSLSRSMWMEG